MFKTFNCKGLIRIVIIQQTQVSTSTPVSQSHNATIPRFCTANGNEPLQLIGIKSIWIIDRISTNPRESILQECAMQSSGLFCRSKRWTSHPWLARAARTKGDASDGRGWARVGDAHAHGAPEVPLHQCTLHVSRRARAGFTSIVPASATGDRIHIIMEGPCSISHVTHRVIVSHGRRLGILRPMRFACDSAPELDRFKGGSS